MVDTAKSTGRLAAFKRLLAHINESVLPDVAFATWDGETVPAAAPPDMPVVAFADEGAVAALVRRPGFHTALNLWVTGRIDVRNGTVLDVVAHAPTLRGRAIRERIDKRLVLSTAAKFLFVPRGGPWPLESVRGDKARADGSAAANTENIQFHYDLSNAFYALFLDPEMIYSCGYFTDWNNDLATAQRDKLDIICRKLRLQAGERFLDVGCGWGALICHAAQHYGVKAHGLTLSAQQLALAQEKIARLGLQDRVTVELRDYGSLAGSFDKIASVGMFEHVGIPNHQTYFLAINRLLEPGGLYLHHAITMRAPEYERMRRGKSPAVGWVQRYIFPGGLVDYVGMTTGNLERCGFEVHDVEGLREHYARTTRFWHDRLYANREAAEREVGSVTTRLWLIWLAGSTITFVRGSACIFQTLVSKRARGPSGLPPTRADLYAPK